MAQPLVWLVDVLRAAGLNVLETPGWQDRTAQGNAPVNAVGVLQHHTAAKSSPQWPVPSVGMCVNGRPDLDGPLAHAVIGFDGSIHLIAAGRANHAGKARAAGPNPAGDGNDLYIGFEWDYSGETPPSPPQYDAAVRATAAVLKHIGRPPDATRGHVETSVTGKWDPGNVDLDRFRADVAAAMQVPPPGQQPPQVPPGPPPGQQPPPQDQQPPQIPPGPPQGGPPAGPPLFSFTTWGSAVRLHSKPSTQSSVVRTLDGPTPVQVEFQVHGERINAEGLTNDGWAWIPAFAGFVSNIYIDVPDEMLPGVPFGSEQGGPPAGPPLFNFMTWGSAVKLHSKPSRQSSVVRTLDGPTPVQVEFQVHGERVNAEGLSNDGWAWIPAMNGFVSNIYIDNAAGWLPGVPEDEEKDRPAPPPGGQPLPGQPPAQHPGPLPAIPGLNETQVRNAKTIIDVGKAHNLPEQAWVIAVTTALQESSLIVKDHGDKAGPDSRGLFQQRFKGGWGTEQQCMDPVLSSEAFYGVAGHTRNRGLKQVPGWENMPVAAAAQAVQVSKDGSLYAKHEPMARTLVQALK